MISTTGSPSSSVSVSDATSRRTDVYKRQAVARAFQRRAVAVGCCHHHACRVKGLALRVGGLCRRCCDGDAGQLDADVYKRQGQLREGRAVADHGKGIQEPHRAPAGHLQAEPQP